MTGCIYLESRVKADFCYHVMHCHKRGLTLKSLGATQTTGKEVRHNHIMCPLLDLNSHSNRPQTFVPLKLQSRLKYQIQVHFVYFLTVPMSQRQKW